MALAITPPGEFGDFPGYGKASNRGSRPHCGSDRTAQQAKYFSALETAYLSNSLKLYYEKWIALIMGVIFDIIS